jgi:hypothetical protein
MMHSNPYLASRTGTWTPTEPAWLAPVTYISPQAEAAHVIANRKASQKISPAVTAALAVLGTVTAMVLAVLIAYRSGLRLQTLTGEPPFGVGALGDDTENDTDQE